MGKGAGPKSLFRVGGKSLLGRLLESLQSVGVQEIVLVVGFGKEEIIREAQAHTAKIRLQVLENKRFQEGAILSLWTAQEYLDRPVLIMDTDVLVPPAALERLTGSRHVNCLLVDRFAPDTGEEQMVFGQGNRVLHIAKAPSAEIRRHLTRFGESVGFLKLSSEGAKSLRRCLEVKIHAGAVRIEHEQVYPDLFQEVKVGYEPMNDLAWIEIDTPEDLERARQEIFPKWTPPACLNRVIAASFLPWVLRFPFTPNQWTSLGLLLGLGASVVAASGTRAADLWAALLFQLFYLTDNWDGDVARERGLSSRWGGWFDVSVDMIVQVGLILGMTVGLVRSGAPDWVMGFGLISAAGIALDCLVILWAKWRGFGPSIYGDPTRFYASDSGSTVVRWMKREMTHENFSLLVAAVLAFQVKLPFLIVVGTGAQFFWVQYLWKERRRLFAYSFAQARR